MSENMASGLLTHHILPFDVVQHGDDDIEGVEGCFEGQTFVKVESRGHNIHDNPDNPLLEILPGQCPNAYKGKGRRESVGYRNG